MINKKYEINQTQLNTINAIIKTLNIAIQRKTFSDSELDKIFKYLDNINNIK